MEINWRKKSKKPCVSEKNRITCLKFALEHAGVSSSGNVTCGVMSPVWLLQPITTACMANKTRNRRTSCHARNREASEVNQCMGVFFCGMVLAICIG